MSNLISKSDFYLKLREKGENYLETIGDKSGDEVVVKNNIKLLIDLCNKRFTVDDHSLNNSNDNQDSDTDESSLNGQQSEQTIEESIENGEKWLIKIRTPNGRRYKCGFNGCQSNVCTKKYRALAHVWGHTGDRPYKCGESGCDYSGRRKDLLKEHCISHTGEKPHKCPISDCEYSAIKQRSLKRHLEAKHSTDSDRLYECRQTGCEYRTKVRDNYRRHARKHNFIITDNK